MRRVPLSSNQSAKDSGHYHVGHPRAGVPQYGRDVSMETRSMKKFSMLGIIGGAALLAAVPFSLQWSQENVGSAVPLLTVSQANAQYYYGPYRRHVRRVYRRAYRRAYYGYPYCRVGRGRAYALPLPARSNGSCSFPASRFPVRAPLRR